MEKTYKEMLQDVNYKHRQELQFIAVDHIKPMVEKEAKKLSLEGYTNICTEDTIDIYFTVEMPHENDLTETTFINVELGETYKVELYSEWYKGDYETLIKLSQNGILPQGKEIVEIMKKTYILLNNIKKILDI